VLTVFGRQILFPFVVAVQIGVLSRLLKSDLDRRFCANVTVSCRRWSVRFPWRWWRCM